MQRITIHTMTTVYYMPTYVHLPPAPQLRLQKYFTYICYHNNLTYTVNSDSGLHCTVI